MTTLSARFKQAPLEKRRYVMDFSLQLSAGELLTDLTVSSKTSPTGGDPTALVIDSIVIASSGLQVVFYAYGGEDGQSYEIAFLAETSIAQKFEDVIQIDVVEKV